MVCEPAVKPGSRDQPDRHSPILILWHYRSTMGGSCAPSCRPSPLEEAESEKKGIVAVCPTEIIWGPGQHGRKRLLLIVLSYVLRMQRKKTFLQDRLTLQKDCSPHVTFTSSNSSLSLSCHFTEKFGKHAQESELQSIKFVQSLT